MEKLANKVEDAESLYATAFDHYEREEYTRASELFLQLLSMKPFEERFWKGLASCRQMEQSYPEALQAWSVVAVIADPDPMPHFHAAECLIAMKNPMEAVKALNCAEQRITANDQALVEKIHRYKELCV